VHWLNKQLVKKVYLLESKRQVKQPLECWKYN